MDDEAIIELFRRRSQQAIEETDRKYGRLCAGISYNILSDREDSEECVSDTYLALWNRIPPEHPAPLRAYIASVVRNISLMKLRERRSAKHGGGEAALALDELADVFPSGKSVEYEAELTETVESINTFLRTLPQGDRRIFISRYWLFMPTAEIARSLGFSQSKVLTSLCRTRKKLRSQLVKEGLI